MKRFAILSHAGFAFLGGVLVGTIFAGEPASEIRPNFLWLDAEDANVSWIGCYGNPAVSTPNIDRLAAEGFRYTHAFASAPVCSPSRSTWITGINAVSMGTTPLRTNNAIPHDRIRYYADYLREAGYFALQPGKTDYNIGGRPDRDAWDRGRSWDDRAEGQPFFHIAHFAQSHEGQAFGDISNPRHDPERQRIRAYHPDIPDIRYNYAHYADAVERMDAAVGNVLARLEADGLAESTIVIFTTDYGGVMPGSKRFLTDSGTHSPFILRIPEKFKHLWPAEEPGIAVDRLVSFVDMPKTWLSIAGAEVPDHMQGRIFLGPDKEPEPEMHFAFTSRQAERFYEMRAVRTKDLLYIKNYKPYMSTGQRLSFLWQMIATRAWEAHHEAGLTDEVTGAFFQRRQPVELLFDVREDPDNVINLVDHPDYQEALETMRSALREWQLEVRDTGILSEEEMARRARERNTTIYELARDPEAYPLDQYLDAADLALAADPANMARLISFTNHDDSGIRYWGVVGLLMFEEREPASLEVLKERLADDAHDVRALAAWALFESGVAKEAVRACLIDLLDDRSYASLLALNVIDLMEDDLVHYLPSVRKVAADFGNYTIRMREYFENGKSWDTFGMRIRDGEPVRAIQEWERRRQTGKTGKTGDAAEKLVLAEDGAWGYNCPHAVLSGGKLFFSYIDSAGMIRVASRDNETRAIEESAVFQTDADLHEPGGLVVRSDGRIQIFINQRVNGRYVHDKIFWRVSDAPGDVSSFGELKESPSVGAIQARQFYPLLHQSSGDVFVVLPAYDQGRLRIGLWRFTDGGDTFADYHLMFGLADDLSNNRSYTRAFIEDDDIHLVAVRVGWNELFGAGTLGRIEGIYYTRYNIAEQAFFHADGRRSFGLDDAPVHGAEYFDEIWHWERDGDRRKRAKWADIVAKEGRPYIAFTVVPADGDDPLHEGYWATPDERGEWRSHWVATLARGWDNTPRRCNYSIAIHPEHPETVYVAMSTDAEADRSQVHRMQTTDGGRSWSSVEVLSGEGRISTVVVPWRIDETDREIEVLWLEGPIRGWRQFGTGIKAHRINGYE